MTTDINKLLERLRTYYGDDLACRMLLMDARHALEALAGEVVLLREAMMEIDPHLDEDTEAVQRFRKALEATK